MKLWLLVSIATTAYKPQPNHIMADRISSGLHDSNTSLSPTNSDYAKTPIPGYFSDFIGYLTAAYDFIRRLSISIFWAFSDIPGFSRSFGLIKYHRILFSYPHNSPTWPKHISIFGILLALIVVLFTINAPILTLRFMDWKFGELFG